MKLATVLVILLIMFIRIEVASDILIVPCSCILLMLCYSECGLLYRLMEIKPLKFVGQHSLYIYLCQGFSLDITSRICNRIGGLLKIDVFNIKATILLVIISVVVALAFEYFLMPWTKRLCRGIMLKSNV